MKSNLWVKTLLYTYKYLNRITDGIDQMVEKHAINSFYFCNSNLCDNSTMVIADKIIEMIERKKRLINIKVLVDKSLLSCDRANAQILVERFIDDDSAEVVAKRRGINIRTFFRKQERAENDFYSQMARLGYGVDMLEKYLASEGWIIDVFERFNKEEQEVLNDEMAMSV
jgi:hypothetical protein